MILGYSRVFGGAGLSPTFVCGGASTDGLVATHNSWALLDSAGSDLNQTLHVLCLLVGSNVTVSSHSFAGVTAATARISTTGSYRCFWYEFTPGASNGGVISATFSASTNRVGCAVWECAGGTYSTGVGVNTSPNVSSATLDINTTAGGIVFACGGTTVNQTNNFSPAALETGTEFDALMQSTLYGSAAKYTAAGGTPEAISVGWTTSTGSNGFGASVHYV